jgi:hypothetical protein
MSLELSHHANTLNSSRRTGSFRSWIDPPRLCLTSLFVNSSQMSGLRYFVHSAYYRALSHAQIVQH